jgi:hypothetical protein
VGGDQQREPVPGAAERVAGKFGHAAPRQIGELGLRVGVDRRQAVGDVVDDHVDFQAVDRFKLNH